LAAALEEQKKALAALEAEKAALASAVSESKAALQAQKGLQALAGDKGASLTFEVNHVPTPPVLIVGNENILGGGPVNIDSWKRYKKSVAGESEFRLPKQLEGKKGLSSGVIIREPDGRLWLVDPKDGFGGYSTTFPKGRLTPGLTAAQNAAKEVWEETGLRCRVTGVIGDYERSTTYTRYYVGERTGGDPAFAQWESSRVRLVTPQEAASLLGAEGDRPILDDLLSGKRLSPPELVDEASVPLGQRLKSIPGTQGGSNAGGQYVDLVSGEKYYVKFYKNAEQAYSEVAANNLLRELGIGAPESLTLDLVGPSGGVQKGLATKWVDWASPVNLENRSFLLENAEQIAKQHIGAALVENWDVVGLEYDNLVMTPGGKIMVIDSGGSFAFRAQGGAKKFGPSPDAFRSLLDPQMNHAASTVFGPVFDSYTSKNTGALVKMLRGLDDAAISRVVKSSGLSGAEGIARNVMARRDALIRELESLVPKGSTPFDLEAITARVKAARLNGSVVPVDSGQIEDISVLFWEEVDGSTGKTMLRAQLRLTPAGGETLDNLLLKELGGDTSGEKAAARAKAGGGRINPVQKKITFSNSVVKNGRAVSGGDATPWYVKRKTEYNMTLSNKSVSASYRPWGSKLDTEDRPYALRGMINLSAEGGASPATIRAMIKAIGELGIENAQASEAYNELLYLHKTAYLRGDAEAQDYKLIFSDPALSVEEKITGIKKFFQNAGIATDGNPDYKPEGGGNAFGDGWKVWRRFDLPRPKIQADLDGYVLSHRISGGMSVAEVMDKVLNSGGMFSSTLDRVRRGINPSATTSQESDLESGGAHYFFTRIRQAGDAANEANFVFSIGELSRVDAVSYSYDAYGDVTGNLSLKERASTLKQYRYNSKKDGNETIFKNGLDLFSSLDAVIVTTSPERLEVLSVFKSHGVTAVRGVPVEKLVKVR